jgi:hypothetical protein
MLRIPRAALAVPMIFAGLLSSEDASAQQAEQVTTRWYGWQNLITIGASYSVIGVGIGVDAEWLIPVGVAGYAFGGPVVHLAHGRPSAAGAGLALNLGLPLAGGLLGYGLLCGLGDGCRGELGFLGAAAGFVVGGAVGALAANVIDVAVLAREEVPAAPAATTGTSPAAFPGLKGAGAAMPLRLGFRF